MLGLKPWEYYSYSARDYQATLNGYNLKNEIHLDSVRWLATVQARVAGAKKVRKPQDLMKLPLIDGKANLNKAKAMIEFLKEQKAKAGG